MVEKREKKFERTCTDDAQIITELLRGYDRNKLPGGGNVQVSVEVNVDHCIEQQKQASS